MNDSQWKSIIQRSYYYDFHHTQAYHQIDSKRTDGQAILFVHEAGQDFIAMPLIVRKIEDTEFKDCTSVYGFCGPVSNLSYEEIPTSLISGFKDSVESYFHANRIVTAFSRLHPLINAERIFKNFGIIKEINKTVAIDLRQQPEEQYRQYRKSNKSEINQLKKKKGYRVIEATSDEELGEFLEIYHENMKRVNATDYYFFDLDYFKSFLGNTDFESRLLLSVKDERITAGAIFTITNKIMQYHLAGTRQEFMRDTPMKLIIDQARVMGNELEMEFLHLGGGVGGRDDDTLFRFKSGFSQFFGQFSAWQYISDDSIYAQLNSKYGKNNNADFFPIYRSPD